MNTNECPEGMHFVENWRNSCSKCVYENLNCRPCMDDERQDGLNGHFERIPKEKEMSESEAKTKNIYCSDCKKIVAVTPYNEPKDVWNCDECGQITEEEPEEKKYLTQVEMAKAMIDGKTLVFENHSDLSAKEIDGDFYIIADDNDSDRQPMVNAWEWKATIKKKTVRKWKFVYHSQGGLGISSPHTMEEAEEAICATEWFEQISNTAENVEVDA